MNIEQTQDHIDAAPDLFRAVFKDTVDGLHEEFYDGLACIQRAMTHYDSPESRLAKLKISMIEGSETKVKGYQGAVLATLLQVLRVDPRIKEQMGEDNHDHLMDFADEYMTDVYSNNVASDDWSVRFKIRFIEGLSLKVQYEYEGDIRGIHLIF